MWAKDLGRQPAENLLIKSFRRNYNFPFLQHNFRLSSLLSHSVVLLASFNFLLAAVSIASILIRRNPTCRCRFASHTRHKNLSPRSRSKMFLIFSHKNLNSLKILMWINFFCCSRRWFSPKQFSQRAFTANRRQRSKVTATSECRTLCSLGDFQFTFSHPTECCASAFHWPLFHFQSRL